MSLAQLTNVVRISDRVAPAVIVSLGVALAVAMLMVGG